MKKKFLKFCPFLLVVLSTFIFMLFSCHIGLGPAVDTQAPKLEILYPPAAATIKGEFVFAGTCSDDIKVAKVHVVVKNSDTNKDVEARDADISADGTSWSIELNKNNAQNVDYYNGWQFADGTYEISVTAYDDAGHSSGTSSRSFAIDNTPPVLVLTKPTSVGSNTPKSYGRAVQLEGTFSEACSTGISTLTVSFYDQNGTAILDSQFKDITDMSNSNPLTIAQYFTEDERKSLSAENKIKWENYQKLYKNQLDDYENGGESKTENFFFTVTASDAAKEYKDVNNPAGYGDGNASTQYYRGTTDMLNLINGKNTEFQSFSAFELRKYLNKTDEKYKDASALKEILSAATSESHVSEIKDISKYISNTKTSQGNVYLTFSVNPKNNPTYSVGGMSIMDSADNPPEDYTDGYAPYFAGSAINVSITPGLDNTNLRTSSISIYYKIKRNTDDDSGEEQLFWTWDEAVALKYAKMQDPSVTLEGIKISSAAAATYRYTITTTDQNTDSLSVSSTLTTADVKTGNKYKFFVVGKDIDGQGIVENDSAGYGFMAKSSSVVPTLNIDENKPDAPYKNMPSLTAFNADILKAGIEFSGTVMSGEPLVEGALRYNVTLEDTTGSSKPELADGFIDYKLKEGTQYDYDWSFTFEATDKINKAIKDGDGLFTLDVSISAQNGGGTSAKNRTYYLDTKEPGFANIKFTSNSKSSQAYAMDEKTYYLNNKSGNKFTLTGVTTDNYKVSHTTYEIKGIGSDDKDKIVKPESPDENMSWSFSDIDLSGFEARSGETDAVLTITTYDSAENSFSTYYNIEFDTTGPKWSADNKDYPFTISGKAHDSDKSWYKDSMLPVSGVFAEEDSGVSRIYYWVRTPDMAEPNTGETATATGLFEPQGTKGNLAYFTNHMGAFEASKISGTDEITPNYLYLVAADNVGNMSARETIKINIDTEPPMLSCTSHAGQQYTNGVAPISGIKGEVTDNVSGVSSVEITLVEGKTIPAKLKNANSVSSEWEAEILSDYLKNLEDNKTYNVSAKVTDGAENTSTSTIFSLQVDKTPPTVTINSPVPGKENAINGTISVQGGVSYEGAAPVSLALYYSKEPPNAQTELDNLTPIGEKITDPAKIYSWSIENVNVYELAGVTDSKPSAPLYLIPVVTDSAGNCNVYTESDPEKKTYSYAKGINYFEYIVDQNTDRPIIQIQNVDDTNSWLTTTTLRGIVTDDDGVSAFYISQSENGNDWKSVSVSNGTWSYDISGGDNDRIPLRFKVEDSAGTAFVTGDQSKFNRPYYMFSTTQNSEFDDGDYGLDNKDVLYIKMDTAMPNVHTAALDIKDKAENLVNAEVVKLDAGGTYDISASRFAGGNSKYIKVYLPIFDANISGATLSISDGSSGVTETKYRVIKDGVVTDIESDSLDLKQTDSKKNVDGIEYTYYESEPIVVSEIESGLKTLTLTAKDLADNSTPITAVFYVDNKGPDNITVTSPASSDQATGTVKVTGIASDEGVGISDIEWLVPPKGYGETNKASPNYRTDDELIALDGWTNENLNSSNSAAVWQFNFMAGTKHDLIVYDDPDQYDVVYSPASKTYKIPLFFKTIDKLGNYYIYRSYYITHNPDADRPVTELSYPSVNDYDSQGDMKLDYITLAGTIRVSGNVEVPSGTSSVGQVYVQIGTVAANGDVTWSKDNPALTAEFASLGGVLTPRVQGEEISLGDYQRTTYVDESWWGIPANLKTSTWNITLNKDGLLDPDKGPTETTTNIAIRACAINTDGKMGLWTDAVSDPIFIHVDNGAPSQEAQMMRYSAAPDPKDPDANLLSIMDYNSEMYLKGTWYLVVKLKDNDSLNADSISVKQGSSLITASCQISDEAKDSDESVSRVVYIPIETTKITTSSVNYTVYVADTSGHSSNMTYTFYIDNTAPDLSNITANGTSLSESQENPVSDSDYVFTLQGTFVDKGSGYERVAFYFLRDGKIFGTGADYTERLILDPLIVNEHKDNFDPKIRLNGLVLMKDITNEPGDLLYAAKAEGPAISYEAETGTYSFTDTGNVVRDNVHIHSGGLIYAGGAYGVISEVDGSTVRFKSEAEVTDDKNAAVVYFPYAQNVDNTKNEDVRDVTGKVFEFNSGDDGDCMPESITSVGTTWTWKATIHSTNIPDGPAQLVVVAFDAAGNVSNAAYPVSVTNNAPRLARLYLGTDLNSDGVFTQSEFNGYDVSAVNSESGITTSGAKSAVSISTKKFSAGQFTVKDKLAIMPEITGGNGDIRMAYKRGATDTSAVTAKDDSLINSETESKWEIGSVDFSDGNKIHKFELSSKQVWQGLTSDPAGETKVSFTFWDKTDERTQGSNSQNCVAYVTDLIIDLSDDEKPTAEINPFYWKDAADNSLYENSTKNGHIELEADWKTSDGYKSNASKGEEYDADPKVSGKIKITGTAHDNKMLRSVSIKATGFDFGKGEDEPQEFATYDGSVWKISEATMENNGWQFVKDEETLTQSGHTIHWTFYLDTEKVSGRVKTDVKVIVTAKDFASKTQKGSDNESTGSSTSTKADALTSCYQMDIVPYITDVETSLSTLKKNNPSVYARTALGHYPVRSDETVTLKGFNLNANGNAGTYPLDISRITKSGEYNHTVGGISALNNMNDNDSRGNYEKVTHSNTGDYSVYSNYYNRLPNNDNNNRLTDDVVFDVWEFNSRAAVPISGKIEQPVMKVRPTDGKIGFAFVNGPLYFSMGEGPGGRSYQYWTASYDFFTSVAFAYDDKGNSWGVAAGGDINSGESDAFILMSSKFDRGAHNSRGSYDGVNALRLERIGQLNVGEEGRSWVRQVICLDGGQDYTGGWIKLDKDNDGLRSAIAENDLVYFCDEYGNVITPAVFRLYDLWPKNPKEDLAFKISASSIDDPQVPFTRALGNASTDYNDKIRYKDSTVIEGGKDITGDNVYIKIVKAKTTMDFDKQRIKSPSIATSTSGQNDTNVYLAYYDTMNDELRFKSGTSKQTGKAGFGQFQDSATYPAPYYDALNVSMIASGTGTEYKPGSYLSIGVVANGDRDRVIAVWLDQADAANPTMRYAYNDNPVEEPGNWECVRNVFPENSEYANAGEYCKVAVDSDGGVHIAAYDQKNLDLVYAYLPASKKGKPSSPSDFVTCVVDSNGVVGSNLTIDVGKYDEDHVVPHIGYYATSSIRPKMAYYVGGFEKDSSSIAEGSVNDQFTGTWECATVPTPNAVEMQSNQHNDINIGLRKTDGVITNFTKETSSTFNSANSYDSISYGDVYGNGTDNAVLGYVIKSGATSDAIETAQMK